MKTGEWANTRLGESVSDLYRAKRRLGELKLYAVFLLKSLSLCLSSQKRSGPKTLANYMLAGPLKMSKLLVTS